MSRNLNETLDREVGGTIDRMEANRSDDEQQRAAKPNRPDYLNRAFEAPHRRWSRLPVAYPTRFHRLFWRSEKRKLMFYFNMVSAEGLEPSTP